MRKIINSTFITLDGAVENPHMWPSLSGASDESYAIEMQLLEACDVVLMGRRTYDVFAPVWSARSGDAYSDRINAMQKVVVSRTLANPTWQNTSVISSDVAGAIGRLKQQSGMSIVQYGIGQVTNLMLENGLVDEFRLWIHPLILGRNGPDVPHFRQSPPTQLRLTGSRPLANGVVLMTYAAHE